MKKIIVVLVTALLVFSVVLGCAKASQNASDGEKKLKFAYICKKLNDEWFGVQDEAMIKAAKEYGVVYLGIDVDYNNERCMQAIETIITDGFDAVMMCIPDAGLSTAVVRRLREANIPLLAIDDYIIDENETQITPYLGVPTYDIGYQVGEALIQMAMDRNFFAPGNVVKVMALDLATIPTVHDTSVGHLDAIKAKSGGRVNDSMIIIADCKEGTFDESMVAATAVFNANPNVTHWIIPVPEDQVAFAAVKMLIENHFNFKNVVICGNGAYSPSKEIFEMGGDIANCYISAKFFPSLEGEAGIRILYEHFTKGTPIPWDTRVGEGYVSIDNWKDWSF
jgi:ABC-type sugar transport system substrate-binding protein